MTSKKNYTRAVLYVFTITFICTATVSAVQALMRDGIKRNQRLRNITGIFQALHINPPKDPQELLNLAKTRLEPNAKKVAGIYAVKNENNVLEGYAIPFKGPGFWGPISGYLGVDPGCGLMVNMVILSHNETPGLGARITEEEFIAQIRNKPFPPRGKSIRLRLPGKPKDRYDIDAITGATGTSLAAEKIINTAIMKARFLADISGMEAP